MIKLLSETISKEMGKSSLVVLILGDRLEAEKMKPAAREALVLIVVALDASWKISIGYFLIDDHK